MPDTLWKMGFGVTGAPGIVQGMTGPSPYDTSLTNEQTKLANIQADASTLPARLQQQRFNAIFPFLSAGGMGGGESKPYTIGGSSGQGPEISVNPVLNPQQIQQQVNSQKAATDQSTGSTVRSQQQSLAGRGVGANSPLAQALAGQAQSAGLATNTANERETRIGAATKNAQQVFQEQQAREGQFASRQQEAIARAQPYFSQRSALIQALSGLV